MLSLVNILTSNLHTIDHKITSAIRMFYENSHAPKNNNNENNYFHTDGQPVI